MSDTILTLRELEKLIATLGHYVQLRKEIERAINEGDELDPILKDHVQTLQSVVPKTLKILPALPRIISDLLGALEKFKEVNPEQYTSAYTDYQNNQKIHLDGLLLVNDYTNPIKYQIEQSDIEKYMKNRGNSCPHCGSTLIEFKDLRLGENSQLAQDIRCFSCEAEWQDIYTVSGIQSIKEPMKEQSPNPNMSEIVQILQRLQPND